MVGRRRDWEMSQSRDASKTQEKVMTMLPGGTPPETSYHHLPKT
jgi:hypothetical protein